MKARRKGNDIFEVESETSTRNYLVCWGNEGNFWSCTCTAYAISRNRRGGMGAAGACKHIGFVETIQRGSRLEAASELRALQKSLEEM